MALVKTLTRVAVIGGLATGTAVLIAGPHRVQALFTQAQHEITDRIDRVIDDPVALRAQLRELEQKYPKRIGEVRGELVDVREQIARLERERGVAERVVDLASADMASLQALLDQAESARVESPSKMIYVRFEGDRLPLEDVYARATRVTTTVDAYRTRLDMTDKNLGFLREQEERLADLLTKLETERAQLQSQLWQLEGEIEMIARNDKLIDMTEARQRAISEFETFEAVSLDQIVGKINKIRAEQESRLESLAAREGSTDYEDKARLMLEAEDGARRLFHETRRQAQPESHEIEIVPEQDVQTTETVASLTIE
jgi:chromosome segregation ATPase